jgi:molybdate transport system substrate-binding protein
MKARAIVSAAAGLSLLTLFAPAAVAAEVTVFCTIGVQSVTPELIAGFERATGHKVTVTYGIANVLKDKFLGGAPADVLVLTSQALDEVIKQGKVAADSKVDFARSGVGVAVKAGAPRPDISTPEKLKAALLAAKSVGYSKVGASGIAFHKAIEKLGIADQVAAKYTDAAGKTGEMVAKGEIEIGAQQIPELMAVPGVDIIGPLPGELQVTTVFSAGVTSTAKDTSAAKAFIQHLTAPGAAPLYKAKGFTS